MYNELRGPSLLIAACIIVTVLWVSKGTLGLLTSLPLVAQVLQLLGLVYVAELLVGARRLPGLPTLPTLPPHWFATPAPTDAPA